MPAMVEHPVHECASSLSASQLERLKHTFDDASRPVWIHDLSHKCVYMNAAALAGPDAGVAVIHEIHDHEDRTLAYLKLGAA